MIERWIIHDDGSIRVPGIDYGPKGLKLVDTIKKDGGEPVVFIARSFGHKGWKAIDKSEYVQAAWIVAKIVRRHRPKVRRGYDRAEEIVAEWSADTVHELYITRKRKQTLEAARALAEAVAKKASQGGSRV